MAAVRTIPLSLGFGDKAHTLEVEPLNLTLKVEGVTRERMGGGKKEGTISIRIR